MNLNFFNKGKYSTLSYSIYDIFNKKSKVSIVYMDKTNISFLVNSQKAGQGLLEVTAEQDEKEMPVQMKNLESFLYEFSVNPTNIGPLKIYLLHNEQVIAGTFKLFFYLIVISLGVVFF